MALALSKSENISNGKSTSKSSCWRSEIVYLACLAQVVSAMYSASVDESATVHCLHVVQETRDTSTCEDETENCHRAMGVSAGSPIRIAVSDEFAAIISSVSELMGLGGS